jgi:uncharacterized protein YydD (DUF2326 family)
MFLKNLTIKNGDTIVRNIDFHKGVNLLIDNTPKTLIKQSGNSVGKTTVLRLVYFCLGGDGKNIYSDLEFPDKSNSTIKNYLKNNNIKIFITLVDDLENENSYKVVICRNFFIKNKENTNNKRCIIS